MVGIEWGVYGVGKVRAVLFGSIKNNQLLKNHRVLKRVGLFFSGDPVRFVPHQHPTDDGIVRGCRMFT